MNLILFNFIGSRKKLQKGVHFSLHDQTPIAEDATSLGEDYSDDDYDDDDVDDDILSGRTSSVNGRSLRSTSAKAVKRTIIELAPDYQVCHRMFILGIVKTSPGLIKLLLKRNLTTC